ncbi:hypothetical protein ACFLRC_02095, partial [Candidatus Altiarchaeota archaeon]
MKMNCKRLILVALVLLSLSVFVSADMFSPAVTEAFWTPLNATLLLMNFLLNALVFVVLFALLTKYYIPIDKRFFKALALLTIVGFILDSIFLEHIRDILSETPLGGWLYIIFFIMVLFLANYLVIKTFYQFEKSVLYRISLSMAIFLNPIAYIYMSQMLLFPLTYFTQIFSLSLTIILSLFIVLLIIIFSIYNLKRESPTAE